MPVNLVYTSDIEAFFLQQAEGDSQIAQWLEMALTKSLRRRPESAVEITELPDDAPVWLQNKWKAGGPFHRFRPDPELITKVRHIRDWLSAARAEDAPFLRRTDIFGNPLKLLNLDLDASCNAADKFFERLNQRSAGIAAVEADSKMIMRFPDGFCFVQMLTPGALKIEGRKMGNCLGTLEAPLLSGDKAFFSLRDAQNEPHVTLSLKTDGNLLDECRGKRDCRAVGKYMPYVLSFIAAQKVLLPRGISGHPPGSHRDIPGYLQDGAGAMLDAATALVALSGSESLELSMEGVKSLPDGFTVKKDLRLSFCYDLESLGKNLSVGGNLTIAHCRQLTDLGKSLKISGMLSISNCSGLRALPEGTEVGKDLFIFACPNLASLGEGLKVGASVRISSCPELYGVPQDASVGGRLTVEFNNLGNLYRLPPGLVVEGDLVLERCRHLSSLPEGLKVMGDLKILGCTDLKELPEGIFVGGQLTLAECPIEELPANLTAQGALSLTKCKRLKAIRGPLNVAALGIRDCEKLAQLPDELVVRDRLEIFRCPSLGGVLPASLRDCRYIRTDLFLSAGNRDY